MEVSGARAAGIPTICCDSVREIVSAEGTTVWIDCTNENILLHNLEDYHAGFAG